MLFYAYRSINKQNFPTQRNSLPNVKGTHSIPSAIYKNELLPTWQLCDLALVNTHSIYKNAGVLDVVNCRKSIGQYTAVFITSTAEISLSTYSIRQKPNLLSIYNIT
ncbi:hypothetical protein DI53_1582 [Sphingobacterium deserti]|uniref:Uncharacterized protein n=1 Tax=Sphingobacterium deserti TaxID=1229276 RepID=A0A0B8T4E8_9SPHI|nr:hypothetical protein DI53_1582 [Sphingobacterium deserti]